MLHYQDSRVGHQTMVRCQRECFLSAISFFLSISLELASVAYCKREIGVIGSMIPLILERLPTAHKRVYCLGFSEKVLLNKQYNQRKIKLA
jgi:hypothetical protein